MELFSQEVEEVALKSGKHFNFLIRFNILFINIKKLKIKIKNKYYKKN